MSRRILSGVLDSVSRGYSIANSLKLDANHQNTLDYTPNVTGNRRTFTLSMWFKMVNPDRRHMLYTFGSGGIQYWRGGIEIFEGGYYLGSGDTQLLRDPSAWYHIVAYVDTTQSTAANRSKIYINGVEQNAIYSNYWPQNYEMSANLASTLHQIGAYASDPLNTTDYALDGNIAEFNWIDGQALPATSFGQFNSSGQWVPIRYSGTYGTNGVYLPFSNNSNAENIFRNSEEFDNSSWNKSNTTITANATTAPDGSTTADKFAETVSSAEQHLLFQTLPWSSSIGDTYTMSIFAKSAERSKITITMHGEGYPVFDLSSGTVIGAGGSNTSNSIVDYGNGWYRCSSTFVRTNTTNTFYFGIWTTTNNYVGVNGNGVFVWGAQLERTASPTPYIKTVSSRKSSPQFGKDFSSTLSTKNYVCNNIPNTNGTGRWDSSYGPHRYWRYVESSSLLSHHPRISRLVLTTTSGDTTIATYAGDNCSDSGSISPGTVSYDFGSAVQVLDAKGYSTFSGDNRIVKAHIEWSDDNSNWTRAFTGIAHNAGGDCGLVPILGRYTNAYSYDTPTSHDALGVSRGNFATLNRLSSYGSVSNTTYRGPVYNGGLTISGSNDTLGTIGVKSGKWYWEVRQDRISQVSGNVSHYGIAAGGFNYAENGVLTSSDFIMIRNDSVSTPGSGKQGITSIGSNTATFSAISVGDTVGIELDLDSATKTLKMYKNNSLIYSVTFAYDGVLPIHPFFRNNKGCIYTVNFGQTPFAYNPPSGSTFKSLNSNNLPVPNIVNPKQYFDVANYTGNGVNSPNSQVISGYNLQPDMVLIKATNSGQNWHLQDSVNGLGNFLGTNLTNANSITGGGDISSLNSDGYTISYANNRTNGNTINYSSWMWKESAVSGFDIVTYTGNSTSGRAISHNLASVPKFIMVKATSATSDWAIYHTKLTNATYDLKFTTAGQAQGYQFGTTPTSSVFYVGGSGSNTNSTGVNYIAYVFSEVPGFSQFGSYIGNGSTNGPFIDLGFRPAMVIIKNTTTEQWCLIDYKRPLKGNSNTSRNLYMNSGAAEDLNVDYHQVDKVANGFKVRGAEQGLVNGNGSPYIYAAFAEVPFKYALAR
jgi:hypothetical protein